jgi:hypothetical protein
LSLHGHVHVVVKAQTEVSRLRGRCHFHQFWLEGDQATVMDVLIGTLLESLARGEI